MILAITSLTTQQRDTLELVRRMGGMSKVRGGYAAVPGAKPVHERTIRALTRYNLVALNERTHRAEVTADGTKLLLQGFVEQEDLAS